MARKKSKNTTVLKTAFSKKTKLDSKSESEICQTPLSSCAVKPSQILFSKKKESKCNEYFRIEFFEDVKFGVCLICEEKSQDKNKENVVPPKPIPMAKGNTSGLRNHLQLIHPKEYQKLCPNSSHPKQ